MKLSLTTVSWTCLLLGALAAPVSNVRFLNWLMLGDPLILLAGILLLVNAYKYQAAVWLPWWLILAFLLMMLGPLAEALAGGVGPPEALYYPISMVVAMFVVPFVIASHQLVPRDKVGWLLAAWIAGNLIQAVIAILQSQDYQLAWMSNWLRPDWGTRVSAMTFGPGILGCYMGLLVPVCLSQALDSKSWLRFLFFVLATAVLFYTADLTGTRAAILAAAATGALTLALFLIRRDTSALGVRFLQLAVVLGAAVLLWNWRTGESESAVERLLGLSKSGAISNHERAALVEASLDAFWEKPLLGEGYQSPHLAHNMLLGVLRSGGIAGFVGFALLHLGYASYVFRLFVMAWRGEVAYGAGAGLLGMFAAWLVLGVGSTPYLDRVPYIGFGLAALYVATHRRAAPGPEPAPAPAFATQGRHALTAPWR